MVRVLFVCYGNICRSTMAEFVLKDMVAKRGLSEQFHIESAATSTEELGNPVYPGTQRVLRAHGIGGFEGKRARQLRRADCNDFDLIIGMDEANMRNMGRVLGGDAPGTLHKLLEFAGSGADINDPWYTGDFDTTYREIMEGLEGFFEEVVN